MLFNIKLFEKGFFNFSFCINPLNISQSVLLVPLGQDFRKAFPTTFWGWALLFTGPNTYSPKT